MAVRVDWKKWLLLLVWICLPAEALWFAPRPEPAGPWPPSTPPCVYDADLNRVELPAEGPFALLVVDYEGYARGDELTRSVYDEYFQSQLHARLVDLLPVYVLLSAQDAVAWGDELEVGGAKQVLIPCGAVDDPDSARDYAYATGLYLYRDGTLAQSYFLFPFTEMGQPEAARIVLDDVERFEKGRPLRYPPIALLAPESRADLPDGLEPPVFLMWLTGLEWVAPAGEVPLKRPRIVRDAEGNVVDYQEFPSGHVGARGRYLIEQLSSYLEEAGVTPVGLVPPEAIVRELGGAAASGALEKMRAAFPGWTFLQLDAAGLVRFREASIYPCLVRADRRVECFSFYITKPVGGRFLPFEAFPEHLKDR